jgi:hypothetical protein
MQVLRKEVLSAPTSFFALAFLRQAVRLACFAAASLGGAAAGVPGAAAAVAGVAAGVAAGASPEVGGAANAVTADKLRTTAAARVEKRMGARIAPAGERTDEARMKLA